VITKLQWSHGRLNSATNFTKPEKNTNIFWFSNFETRIEGNSKQSKIFLDFSNTKLKIGNNANQKLRKLKRQTKRNNGNIFGLFVFWKAEIRTRTTKKRKKTKHGYTKYRQNMICR
jgi:hypothetical protein